MNKRRRLMIGIVVVLAILVGGLSYRGYTKAHTFTLSGEEQIQPVTGAVSVTSPFDTDVVFVEVETGDRYVIPYLSSGMRETIQLEKDKWYRVEPAKGLTMRFVNVRIA